MLTFPSRPRLCVLSAGPFLLCPLRCLSIFGPRPARYWPVLVCAVFLAPFSARTSAASSGRACVRYWPVLPSFVFGGPMAHIISFFGPRLMPLLACRAAAFLPCSRQGLWPLLFSVTPFSGRVSVRYWPVLTFLFSPRRRLWPSFFLFLWLGAAVLAGSPTSCYFCRPHLCALLACRASFLLGFRRSRKALLVSPAAFMLCPRRGPWMPLAISPCSLLGPRLRVLLACRDAFLLSLLLWAAPLCTLASPAAFLFCPRRGLFAVTPTSRCFFGPRLCALPPSCCGLGVASGRPFFGPCLHALVPAAFCQALSPQLLLFHSRLRPGGGCFWPCASLLLCSCSFTGACGFSGYGGGFSDDVPVLPDATRELLAAGGLPLPLPLSPSPFPFPPSSSSPPDNLVCNYARTPSRTLHGGRP